MSSRDTTRSAVSRANDRSDSPRTRELLVEAVFTAGVPVRCDTISATILRKMLREARAQVVAPPADDPANRWPQSGEPLYDGAHFRINLPEPLHR